MMKKLKNVILGLACFYLLFLSSCESMPNSWKTDLTKTKGRTAKKDKMIIFTGSDWDEKSQLAFKELFTEEFFEKFSKDFELYNIDIVRDSSLLSAEVLSKNYVYFAEYGIEKLPHVVLETPDNDAYASAEFAVECEDINQFSQLIEKLKKKRDDVVKAKAKIINTDLRASQLVSEKKFREASNEFIKTAEMPELTVADKQMAYYYGAYILAMKEGVSTEEVKSLLKKSLDADPKSEFSIEVNNTIQNLKK